MKKINYFRIAWFMGLISILVLILVIVIEYKVRYQNYKEFIYFYSCEEKLCHTSHKEEIKDKDIYSYYYYSGKNPSIEVLNNYTVIIDKQTLYNYKSGYILADSYNNYKLSEDKLYYIASNNNKYALIDNDGKIIVENKKNIYENLDIVIYEEDNSLNIINIEKKYLIDNPIKFKNKYNISSEKEKITIEVENKVYTINTETQEIQIS